MKISARVGVGVEPDDEGSDLIALVMNQLFLFLVRDAMGRCEEGPASASMEDGVGWWMGRGEREGQGTGAA